MASPTESVDHHGHRMKGTASLATYIASDPASERDPPFLLSRRSLEGTHALGGVSQLPASGPPRGTIEGVTLDRRQQLLACAEALSGLATVRNIVAARVRRDTPDGEIRHVLTAVVRRWSLLDPPRWTSAAASVATRHDVDREHVVPCRVLVDRLIMNPAECKEVLTHAAVLALVTKAEHRRLGGIFVNHAEVYDRMLEAEVTDLEALGIERYQRSGIALTRIDGAVQQARGRR